MASITITFSDGAQTRVVNALCERGGWTAELGIAKGPFAKSVVIDFVKSVVRNHEGDTAAATAREAAQAAADNDIILS